VRRALPVPALAAPQPSAGSPPDAELALVATAVRRLRADEDPRGALVILDEHGARFPAGTLKREATLARVETLLALDRRDDALRVLDAAAISDLPRARAVRATRGELRAELGRCTDALKDFELLLSSDQRDDYAERALYGRAACRARGGDTTRVRADLTLYQALYPNGRFAAEVRRLLAGP
jgi:tetratricopeptide (TPR) repeat protein